MPSVQIMIRRWWDGLPIFSTSFLALMHPKVRTDGECRFGASLCSHLGYLSMDEQTARAHFRSPVSQDVADFFNAYAPTLRNPSQHPCCHRDTARAKPCNDMRSKAKFLGQRFIRREPKPLHNGIQQPIRTIRARCRRTMQINILVSNPVHIQELSFVRMAFNSLMRQTRT